MRGLSAKAVAEQEPTLHRFVSLFIRGIRHEVQNSPSQTIDIAKWFSLATFDVIAELSFGASFNGLKSGEYHPWVTVVFGAFKALLFLRVLREIPGVLRIGNHATTFLPKRLKRMWYDHFEYAFDLMEHRFKNPKEKRDIIYYIFEGGNNDLTRDEIKESAAQLVMAGSEPVSFISLPKHLSIALIRKQTATFMAGLTYYLSQNPIVHTRLKHEIRSSFPNSDKDITVAALTKLQYLNAVIQEALRLFPPAPDLFPRIIPDGGEYIMGKYLPEGTRVSIAALAACHSASNFDDPKRFWPERWENAETDRRMTASCPFGQGHRSCLGKT